MAHLIMLLVWEGRSKESAQPPSRPQHTLRLSGRACRYPNQIRRYRLDHGWTQRKLAEPVGCRRDTVSGWERGQSFPQGQKILRLARTVDIFVEHFTEEKFFEFPRPQRSRSIPLNALLILPAGATVIADEPQPFKDGQRQLLTTQLLDATIRARHHEQMWVPIRRGGTTEPLVVPYLQWDSAPTVPKSLLMTSWWIRPYARAKGKQPPLNTARLAYENCFSLFVRHEAALKRKDRA